MPEERKEISMTASNEEYKAEIHSLIEHIESNFRLMRLYSVVSAACRRDLEERTEKEDEERL